MGSISFLYEEYKKDPKRVEKLLAGKIEISEKLDGSRFQVQADEGGKLTYFKRKDAPISKIDRTLAKYYEKAIMHFDNFSEEKISSLPEGWRFGMEYFPNLHPVTIVYDRLPLNNLVLTDIQVKDPRDKTIDVITDIATLSKWANILEVERPSIIFDGKLSDTQNRRILDFLNTPYNDLVSRFKTENFTMFILNILNPELKTSFMHNDTAKDIDGLIFKFEGKEAYRVSNPEIATRKLEKKEEKPSDIYNLTLVMLQEFLTSLVFSKIKLKEKTFEDRYIEFVSKAFNMFVKSPIYKENFEKGVDFELPKFLTREESGVNFKYIKDAETISVLDKSSSNRELFKIMLASMRSHKKRASGFFSKELMFHHNELVDKISDYINSFENIKESTFFSFREFKTVFLGESTNWQEDFGKDTGDDVEDVVKNSTLVSKSINEVASFIHTKGIIVDEPLSTDSTMPSFRHISKSQELDNIEKPLNVLRKMFSGEESVSTTKKTPICLLKGKFQPYHNGHVTAVADAGKESGMKVYIVIMSKKLPENGMSRELHKSMMDEAIKTDKNICGYCFSNGRSFSEIVKDLPVKMEAKAFAGSEDECLDVENQTKGSLVSYPMTRHMSTKNVLQKIKDEDYDGYRKLVPKTLWNHFYKIKNEINFDE